MSDTQKNKKPNVPNLRFPGFEGEWESRKIGEDCSVLMCKRIFANQTADQGDVPFYKIGTIGAEPDAYISRELFEEYKAKYNYPRKSEVMVTCAGTVGKTIVFDGADSYYQDSNIVWLSNPKQLYINSFLNYFLSRVNWNKLNSTTITRIYNDNLRELVITFPSIKEQEKIVSLLSLLDQRIAVQSKVIEDFKMLKATLSRKLLWNNPLLSKRVQLSNFGTLKNGYAFKSSEYIPESEFRIVTIANVTGEREISINNCNTIHSLPRDIQEHQKLKPNDILVSLTGNVGRVSLCNLDGCLLNQRVGLFVLNDDYLHEYIFQVLSDIRFLQSMINSGQGAAQMNIGKYDVESFFIPFSEDLNLLNKIADMLYSIDLRITQSMKDLLLLRKQKHYFLSNLFI